MGRSARAPRLLAALVAGALATALVACSLLTGLNADYKAAPEEGGKGGDFTTDVPDDARSATAGGGGDSSMPTKFCESEQGDAGPNGFCWDFEEDPPQVAPNWGWRDSLAIRGTVAVVDGIGMNKSRALRAGVTNPGASSGHAFLHHVLENSPSFTSFRHHEMSFSYAITNGRNLYTAVLGAQGFGTNANQYVGASLYAAGAQGVIDVSDPPGGASGTSFPVKIDEWHRVTILIKRTADSGPYTSTVSVDSTMVQDSLPFNADTSDASTQIWVGTFFSSLGDGSVETIIDDVVLRQSN
jgi:hypothetical protein